MTTLELVATLAGLLCVFVIGEWGRGWVRPRKPQRLAGWWHDVTGAGIGGSRLALHFWTEAADDSLAASRERRRVGR